jgi:hypothetical protein
MDALGRIEPVARPLLGRVDDLLAHAGAAPQHPVWGLLRTVGTVPGDAVAHVTQADPGPLRAASAALREQVQVCAMAEVPVRISWHGAAGTAYERHAEALARHVDAIAERLGDTASYVDELADWCERARGRMAMALADVLASTEAVALGSGWDESGAAADIAAHVLAAAAELIDEARAIRARWGPALAELTFSAPEAGSVSLGSIEVRQ